jgi:hypothetical protein
MLVEIDVAVLAFELADIVLKGKEETLCVLWRHDDARLDIGLRHAWEHADEVEDDLA